MMRCLLGGLLLLGSGFWAGDLYVWAVEVLAILGALGFVRWAAGSRGGLGARRIGGLSLGPQPRSFHRLLWVYCLVMLVGATWTYAAAPPGEWLRAGLGLARNPWDRIGHVFQGALPAVFVLHVRRSGAAAPDQRPVALFALGLAAGLAVAGLFEALEALAQSAAPAGTDFTQTQGDANDRLWDLALAGLGACAATGATLAMRTTRAARPPRAPSASGPAANRLDPH